MKTWAFVLAALTTSVQPAGERPLCINERLTTDSVFVQVMPCHPEPSDVPISWRGPSAHRYCNVSMTLSLETNVIVADPDGCKRAALPARLLAATDTEHTDAHTREATAELAEAAYPYGPNMVRSDRMNMQTLQPGR